MANGWNKLMRRLLFLGLVLSFSLPGFSEAAPSVDAVAAADSSRRISSNSPLQAGIPQQTTGRARAASVNPSSVSDIPSPELKGSILMATTMVNGEKMLWVLIPEVRINLVQQFSSKEAEARYRRLRYNVIKVLPYAHFAQTKYEQLYRDLAMTSSKREQKRLVKNCEKEIKDMFNREVKNLTVTQGKILVKLIDRQTGNSSYEVVRELRGGVTAFFYQSIAKMFGHNLKNQYDPREDLEIESILQSLGYHATYRAF